MWQWCAVLVEHRRYPVGWIGERGDRSRVSSEDRRVFLAVMLCFATKLRSATYYVVSHLSFDLD